MLKLLIHMCTAILNTFYRVVANYPLHHFLVIFVEYLQAFLYIAIMVNLVCYIFLKFAYFVSFETINTLLDEKIILIMKMVTCGTAAIALLAQLAWKVCDIHVKCNNYTYMEALLSFQPLRFTKNNICRVWFLFTSSLVGLKSPTRGIREFWEGKIIHSFIHEHC